MSNEKNNTGIIKLFLFIAIIALIAGLGVITYNVILKTPTEETKEPEKKVCNMEEATSQLDFFTKLHSLDATCDETNITYKSFALNEKTILIKASVVKNESDYTYKIYFDNNEVVNYNAGLATTDQDNALVISKLSNKDTDSYSNPDTYSYIIFEFKNLSTMKYTYILVNDKYEVKTYGDIIFKNSANELKGTKLTIDEESCKCKVETATNEDTTVIGNTYSIKVSETGELNEVVTDYTCSDTCRP